MSESPFGFRDPTKRFRKDFCAVVHRWAIIDPNGQQWPTLYQTEQQAAVMCSVLNRVMDRVQEEIDIAGLAGETH